MPFNNSYAPGAKAFDFDINQISITPKRAEVVDFSDGYYSAAQGVIALKGSKAAGVTSLADLKGLKLGAQTGTTSLTAITDVIKPSTQPLVFDDTNAGQAGAAQRAGRRDPLRPADGVLHHRRGDPEEHDRRPVPAGDRASRRSSGCCSRRAATLVPCVDQALAALKDAGTLADIEKQWLSDVVDVPVLQ